MARTKIEAYYNVAHNYLTGYRRNQARGARFDQRRLLPTITPNCNSIPNANPNTNNSTRTITTRSKSLRAIDPQTQCPLFSSLPFEIRHMIWVAVLGGLNIAIVPRRHRTLIPSVYSQCGCVDKHAHTCPLLGCIIDGHDRRQDQDHDEDPKDGLWVLALVLTCRRVYTETLPIIYTRNKFTFRTFDAIKLFRFLIPASHWNLIRSVHVHVLNILWNNKWRAEVFRLSCEDVLALTALREFTIRVRRYGSGGVSRLVGDGGFEGVVGALEVLGGLEGRVKLVIEVEAEEKGDGEMEVEHVRRVLERKGMDGWVVRAVKTPVRKPVRP
ncbi:hypothetical protein BJY00DRAFT_318899 [Aspergillus carlsbadensis]|nr:hypothetical protein BJY00DRAFT_318899 [Aspergillus carlsbadensis]